MDNKCIICDKELLDGEIFVSVGMDAKRLIYNTTDGEENFLVPDGTVHSVIKFYLCNICSDGIMTTTPKDVANAIVEKNCGCQSCNEDSLIEAHKFSSNHKSAILKDKKCGCFFCMKIFSPEEITNWIEDKIDDTALCPYCNIDAVIGESSGFPITNEFLSEMNKYFFNLGRSIDG
jgi:hypothetical protein